MYRDVVIRCAPINEEIASSTAKIGGGQYSGKYNGMELLLEHQALGRFLRRKSLSTCILSRAMPKQHKVE